MLASTFLAVFFVPVFFVVILRYFKVKPVTMKVDETPADTPLCGSRTRERMRARRSLPAALAMTLGAALERLHAGAALSSNRPRPCSRRIEERRSAATRSAADRPAADIGWKRILPRCRAAEPARARARQQSRPAHRHAECRGGARAVPHPARGLSCPPSTPWARRTISACRRRLSPTGRASSTRSYSAGLGVSAFELDLFGRVRSLRERRSRSTSASRRTAPRRSCCWCPRSPMPGSR